MQALVAIRCLDEGVNIPSIETAFIMASSTNPKEYVQRRGRVLRKFPGKKRAVIYDFVTLPIPLDDVAGYPEDIVRSSKSLAARKYEILTLEQKNLNTGEKTNDAMVDLVRKVIVSIADQTY